mgnify:CR=1 FL=1
MVTETVLSLADADATTAYAAQLAQRLRTLRRSWAGPLQLQLHGDLGAGKTTLARALLAALGHAGRVRSPTYTLCEPYTIAVADAAALPLQVYHFDLYRFGQPEEWFDAGFDEHLAADAITLIEWPDKAPGLLGTPDLSLHLQADPADPGRRLMRVIAATEHGRQLL